MPARHQKQQPTIWQLAKPHIRDILGTALIERGFANPGTTMWRHRHAFVDVVRLCSKYGVECTIHFGCNPRHIGDSQPEEWNCIFRTSLRDTFRFPPDPAAVADLIATVIQPQVLQIVDTWFPRFTSLDAAISLLTNNTSEVFLGNKGSPAWTYALDALKQCQKSPMTE